MCMEKGRGKLAVVAIGGNSLIRDKEHQTVEDQYNATAETCEYIAELIKAGWRVVVTHGNGPQVGFILMRSDIAKTKLHEVPLDSCGADTQGALGYHIQQRLGTSLQKRFIGTPVVTVVTQVEVDSDDPAFKKPDKPIGPFMSKDDAFKAQSEKGWAVTEDAGRGWRRVVASPMPQRIVELQAIQTLVGAGMAVVAVGGGGIPVVDKGEEGLRGVPAVIDKDRASAKLGNDIGANVLIISTATDKAYLNFGKPDQKPIDKMTVSEARRFMAEGHFKAGSMLPKVEAAVQFLEGGNGDEVIICLPEQMLDAVNGKAGTRIVPDAMRLSDHY